MDIEAEFKRLSEIADPVRRRARFVGLLTRALEAGGERPPLVVGGLAVELYTSGGYATSDIDLKGPRVAIDRVLRQWGFERPGESYAHYDLDLYVDLLGEGPELPAEDPGRIQAVRVGEDLVIRVIGVEDIVIDRLCAAKFWRDADSRLWAGEILAATTAAGRRPDLAYLKRRAAEEDVGDEFEALIEAAP